MNPCRTIVIPFQLYPESKGIQIFAKGIDSKVNVTARQEFELAYNDVVVLHVSLCAMFKKQP